MHLMNRNGGAVHFEPCNAIVFYEVADIVYSYLSKLVKFHTVDLTSTTEADINSDCLQMQVKPSLGLFEGLSVFCFI